MIDLKNKRFCILGLQGGGKTELAKYLLSQSKNHLVYDVLKEYDGFTRYIPEDRNDADELTDCVQKLVIAKIKPDLFVIDEANRFCPPKPHPLPLGIAELNDWSRHMGLSWGVICRRPVQLHSDLMELAHYLFIFVLKGKNDRAYLDSILPGLGDKVASLANFHFVIVTESRSVLTHAPIPLGLTN